MASTDYARQVSVQLTHNKDWNLFSLTSPELPGLLLAGRDLVALYADVPAVIKGLYKLDCGLDVEVRPLVREGFDESLPERMPLTNQYCAFQAAA